MKRKLTWVSRTMVAFGPPCVCQGAGKCTHWPLPPRFSPSEGRAGEGIPHLRVVQGKGFQGLEQKKGGNTQEFIKHVRPPRPPHNAIRAFSIQHLLYSSFRVDGTDPKRWFIWVCLNRRISSAIPDPPISSSVESTQPAALPLYIYIYIN